LIDGFPTASASVQIADSGLIVLTFKRLHYIKSELMLSPWQCEDFKLKQNYAFISHSQEFHFQAPTDESFAPIFGLVKLHFCESETKFQWASENCRRMLEIIKLRRSVGN